jgi:hypothetical protein
VATSPPNARPFTLLLRLLPSQGSERRLVGQAVVVDSGEVVPISDQTDLIGLVERLSLEQVTESPVRPEIS